MRYSKNKAIAAILIIGILLFIAFLPYIVILAIIYFIIKKIYETYQEKKGLKKFEGNWVPTEEINKNIEYRETEAKNKQERIQKLFSQGYTAVCRNCEYAYHRKSIESIKCPKCQSSNIENV